MDLLPILALVCGLVAMIAMLIQAKPNREKGWFLAVGFLGLVLLACDIVFF